MRKIISSVLIIALILCCSACAKQNFAQEEAVTNAYLATFVPQIDQINWENLPDFPKKEVVAADEALNCQYSFYYQDYCTDSDEEAMKLATITPEDAAQCAAQELLRQIGTDIGLLTVTITLNNQNPVYVILAPDADGTAPKYQCNVDAKTGQMLELLNLTYRNAIIDGQPIDRDDAIVVQEEETVLEAALIRFSDDLSGDQEVMGDTFINDTISFQYEDYQFICFCKVHINSGACYTISIPCPSIDGDIYQIKYYPDGWESCINDKPYLYVGEN